MEQQSVLIHENELFLFDSHARNEEGLLSPDVLLYLSNSLQLKTWSPILIIFMFVVDTKILKSC